MTELFRREAVLRIDTIEIRDLRFTFSIERTLRPTPNRAEIHVFNLNEDHRRQIAGLRGVSCSLAVGYEGATHTIFDGDMRNAESRYSPPNWDTKLDGADGGNAIRTARVNRSYPPGTSLATVLGDLADAMGVGRGNLESAVAGASLSGAGAAFARGCVVSGAASRELATICRSAGLEYSVQSGTLQLLPLGSALVGDVSVISSDAGLVGDVEVDTRTGGIKFRSLLAPDLVPGRKVQPDTRTVRGGHYRITRAAYKGDTAGQDWYVECEAAPLSQSSRLREYKRVAAAYARSQKESAR